MVEINLWDLPQDKIYIELEEKFHKELFEKCIRRAGSQSKLAKLLMASGEKFAEDMKIDQQRISFWVNKGLFSRLDIIFYLSDMCVFSKETIQKNAVMIKGVGTSLPIYNPKLPLKLTPGTANLLGKFICDGSILDADHHYTATYNNTCKELIDEFKTEILQEFGETQIECPCIDGIFRARVTGLIGYIMVKFFSFENGKKVPKIIINSDRSIKTAFLRAVFDDEGTISKTANYMRVKMKYRNFIKNVASMLTDLGIRPSKISKDSSQRFGTDVYYFCIHGRENIMRYHELIGFTHPSKRCRLEEHINRHIKPSYKPGETEQLICTLLGRQPMTAKEIGNEIHRSTRTAHFFLTGFTKKNKLNGNR